MRLRFIAVFYKYVKKEAKEGKKKNEENERLFEGLYFRNGWHDLFQIWYVFSSHMPVSAQQI